MARATDDGRLSDLENEADGMTVEEYEVTQEHTLKVDRGSRANPSGQGVNEASAKTMRM